MRADVVVSRDVLSFVWMKRSHIMSATAVCAVGAQSSTGAEHLRVGGCSVVRA